MSDGKHFGFMPNSFKCSCGRHYGLGDKTPFDRAANAKRMQDRLAEYMTADMKAFLADFERYHGPVHYTMQEVGVCEGHFNKASKGQPLIAPVFDHAFDRVRRNS